MLKPFETEMIVERVKTAKVITNVCLITRSLLQPTRTRRNLWTETLKVM